MTRHRSGYGSFIAAIFTLALTVALLAAYWAASLRSNANSPAPVAPAATASTDWAQQADDARTELEANTTALHAAHLTGQPISRLTRQCQTAAGLYNEAAAHLNLALINPSKECTP